MRIHISKNKYLNSLFVLMLFSAGIHMLILFYFSIMKSDLHILNYFHILDLDALFPQLFPDTFLGDVIATVFAGGFYFYILKTNKR